MVIRTWMDPKAVRAAYLAASAATVHPHPDNLDNRGLKRPEFVMVDGSPELECTDRALG